MSSPGRVLAILELFTVENPVWSPDGLNQALGYTRTTGYRYVKELVDAGFLQKVSAGYYALGPRIIELDYQLKQTDPLLLAAGPVMAQLTALTAYDTVLSVLFFNQTQIIDIYRVDAQAGLSLTYGRGRPRPFLISAAPKVLLASLKVAQQKKIYEQLESDIKQSEMGPDWSDFSAYLRRVKREGYYLSFGELEPEVGALAVPVYNQEADVVAALASVGDVRRLQKESIPPLIHSLKEAAAEITKKIRWPV